MRVDTIPTPGRPQLQFHHVSELGAAPALSVASPPQAGSAELGTGHPHTFPARVLYCRFIEPLTHKSLWRSNYERPARPGCHPQLGNWNEPNIVDGFAPKRNVALWAAALKNAAEMSEEQKQDPNADADLQKKIDDAAGAVECATGAHGRCVDSKCRCRCLKSQARVLSKRRMRSRLSR